MEEELRTMCNLSEGIYERGMAQGITQEKENVIMNLWNAGKDLSIIKIASGWTEEQIMKVIKKDKN